MKSTIAVAVTLLLALHCVAAVDVDAKHRRVGLFGAIKGILGGGGSSPSTSSSPLSNPLGALGGGGGAGGGPLGAVTGLVKAPLSMAKGLNPLKGPGGAPTGPNDAAIPGIVKQLNAAFTKFNSAPATSKAVARESLRVIAERLVGATTPKGGAGPLGSFAPKGLLPPNPLSSGSKSSGGIMGGITSKFRRL
eukprot:CAMPEP_0183333384 /NCGR_PEP_ID=MMETSP0164_2-20130417/2293_1 /TAXON_ID=221442 /ORGANISM="Coccolithus pelagicus ssp braarudi, Strain PLY182g" /LENGTH=191 /DNA_ID=CAMNT_0025502295 /DNA_START=67 /DNA_END=642 /DNA_ORIENTATION=+